MNNAIQCPNCGTSIDVNKVFAHQMEMHYQQVMADEKKKMQEDVLERQKKLEQAQADFNEKKKRENELFQERLDKEKEAIQAKLQAKLKQNFELELKAQKEELEEKSKMIATLKQKEIEVDRMKRKMQEEQHELEENMRKQLEEERNKLKDQWQKELEAEKKKSIEQARLKIEEEFQHKIKAHEEDLANKSKIISELKQKEIEIERMKRNMHEEKKNWELEAEKRIAKERQEYEEQIIKREHQRIEMKMLERDKIIEDLKKQIKEAQRKAEQGSMQLQGEVQELAIEDYLTTNFPFDEISEIKKGARGGDCLQIVNDGAIMNCGTIYYESKRTKDFQPTWIEKFKADMRDKGADIGVIVTQAMPKDMDRMGELNGVWVCTFEEFKGLSFVLRNTIIRVHRERAGQENKGDKMSLLYDFLTGTEFRMQVEGIVEGFVQMQEDLQKEKNAMHRIWSQREKQLQKVLVNTTGMYGSIKGIAGKAIPTISQLELPEGEDD